MIDFECVRSRILWLKFKFSRVKVFAVVGYDPNEGNLEEMERFCNNLNRIVDRVGNGYRLCVLEDLNGWTEGRVRAGIIGAFGVSGENDKEKKKKQWWSSVLNGVCL